MRCDSPSSASLSVPRCSLRRTALASPGDIYAEGTYYRVSTYSGHGSFIGVPVDLNVCSPSGSWVDDHRWPLYAPGDGTVAVHSDDGGTGTGWGNSIIWTSVDGSERLFMAHLDQFGQTGAVDAGDSIGYVGTTGYSTGDHVHFERSVNGAYSAPELSGVTLQAGSIYRSCRAVLGDTSGWSGSVLDGRPHRSGGLGQGGQRLDRRHARR